MESRTLEQQPAEQLQRSLCDFPTHSRSITITTTTIGPIYTAVCMYVPAIDGIRILRSFVWTNLIIKYLPHYWR